MKDILKKGLSSLKHSTTELISKIKFEHISASESLLGAAKKDGIQKVVVGGIVPDAMGRILLVQRAATEKFLPNVWELPSGHMDAGETLMDALAREIFEETKYKGITVIDYLDSFDYTSRNGKNVRQFNFLLTPPGLDPTLNPEEHQQFKWCTLEDAIKLGGDSTVTGRFASLKDYLAKNPECFRIEEESKDLGV